MKKQNSKKRKKTNIRKTHRIIGISILILLIVSSAIIFIKVIHTSENDNEYIKPYEPSFIKNGHLQFISKDKKNVIKTIAIEIADDDYKRTQGLMWRRSMADSIGMLFIFENEKPLSFWMKNTYLPLDIIYVNKSMEIVTIQENTTPLSEMPIPSDKPAQFAIEVNAGFCSNHGILNGDNIKYEKTDAH